MDIRNKSYKPQISELENRTFTCCSHLAISFCFSWRTASRTSKISLEKKNYLLLMTHSMELSPFVQKRFNAMQLNFIRHILGVRNCIPVGSEIWTSFFNSYLTRTQFCARTVYFSPEYLGLPNIIYSIYLLPISLCYNVNLKRVGLFCSLSYL